MSESKSNVLVTGWSGALGSHVWLRLRQLDYRPVALDLRNASGSQPTSFQHVVHLAGISRGSEHELTQGNIELALALVKFLDSNQKMPETLVYANSVHAIAGTGPYSFGKAHAASILREWCEKRSVEFRDFPLPNLFGEFGKPFNNMVLTTIVHQVSNGGELPKMSDSPFSIASLQSAADALCDFTNRPIEIPTTEVSAAELLDKALKIWRGICSGVSLEGVAELDRRIWGMFLALNFDENNPKLNSVKSDDGHGNIFQVEKRSNSDTEVILRTLNRGTGTEKHFHRHLIEKFFLVDGEARVEFGRAFGPFADEFSIILSPGDQIRFPIGWWHRFTNVSHELTKLLIVSNRLSEPTKPDVVRSRDMVPKEL